ncbi:MAG: DUF2264 domain-containing protein [Treponemataceae bacterium]
MKRFDSPTAQALAANPLETKADLVRSLFDLLAPLESRYSDGCAGYSLGAASAHYASRVALMEGWSRVLWGVAPLIAGGGVFLAMEKHIEGLRRGTDPMDDAYWGEPPDTDQRLVEMAAIALSLLIARERFWDPLSAREKENLHVWLSSIETRVLPDNNWHFFRILVCSAFRRLGLPVNEASETESFDLVETLYQSDGWYIDGCNGNYDFYNPFGFHFYGLVYAKLMGDLFPDRAARYIERARLFAPQFLAFFREDGSIVPYGRSLTYRFAAVSFFSACAFAGVEAVPWPVMKGVLLRNFRWWFSKPILDASGVLTVGYGYPNLVMAEQYNSPTSPYWALKAYLPLALDENHPFWEAEEAPLPEMPAAAKLPVVHFVMNRSTEDVQLLNPGRYPSWEAVQSAAKYCKFAYSARFGFCVSRGSYALEQTGCDSMLVLSEGSPFGGDGYWRERRATTDQRSGTNWTAGRWKPWNDVEITTVLVALGESHLRFHRIRSERLLETAEGGFSIPRFNGVEKTVKPVIRLDSAAAAIALPWAASRIDALPISPSAVRASGGTPGPETAPRTGEILLLSPNLNIVEPSAVVPILRGVIRPGETLLACFVRAGDSETTMAATPPEIEFDGEKGFTALGKARRILAEFEV